MVLQLKVLRTAVIFLGIIARHVCGLFISRHPVLWDKQLKDNANRQKTKKNHYQEKQKSSVIIIIIKIRSSFLFFDPNHCSQKQQHESNVLSYDESHEFHQVEICATCHRRAQNIPQIGVAQVKIISLHEGTCRCNISLGHVLATFPCVCKCCEFCT